MEIEMTRRTGWLSALLFFAAVTSGCAVGPNYRRPTVNVPVTYRGASSKASSSLDQNAMTPTSQQTAVSFGDEQWWEVFQDEELRNLVRTALKNNYDVRIAATRVLEAQAQLGITRADQYPTLGVGGAVADQRSPKIGPIPSYEVSLGQVTASAAWNLDFWGRYRRATESARATLLANEWARKQVMATLVANVATSYFQLRQLDLELEISQRTLGSRSESLKLTQTLEQHGISSLLDVRQSEQLVYTAAEEVPDFERQIALQENTISILLGKNPGDISGLGGLRDSCPHRPFYRSGGCVELWRILNPTHL
jgi:multidrug efflux system outer membrane protein